MVCSEDISGNQVDGATVYHWATRFSEGEPALRYCSTCFICLTCCFSFVHAGVKRVFLHVVAGDEGFRLLTPFSTRFRRQHERDSQ